MLPIRIQPEALTGPIRTGALTGYESAVEAIGAVMVGELGLPLPGQFTVFVFPTPGGYAEALVQLGGVSPARAVELAEHSVGLARPGRLLLNDHALRGARRSAWLGLPTHELTHLAQYELSGGRRGRSEQWLREGMAGLVTARVLERLGQGTFDHRREQACQVARGLPALREAPPNLVDLGNPKGWEARALGAEGRLVYRLAFLLTEDLIRRRGFESLIAYFQAFADSDDRLGHFRRVFGLSLKEFERAALARIREGAESCSPVLLTESLRGPPPGGELGVLDELEENPWDPD